MVYKLFFDLFAVHTCVNLFLLGGNAKHLQGRTIIFSGVAPLEPDINIKAFIKPIGAIIYRTRGRSAIYTAVKLYKGTYKKY
jgi:hypothetical protein